MNILVIGGTYFLGKSFVSLACKNNNVTLFNRGTITNDAISSIKGDRHIIEDILKLKEIDIDVLVDFCAYEKGDIESITNVVGEKIKEYVFISTCDVYERKTGVNIDENFPFEKRQFPGQEGAYIEGKVALEEELDIEASKYGFIPVSIRPSVIYGPGNYAMRESMYFNWIEKAGQVLIPAESDGFFQPVYVDDVAKAILCAVQEPNKVGRALNVCSKKETYESFIKALKNAYEKEFEVIEISIEEILERGLPLPFPLVGEESFFYDGRKAEAIGIEYRNFAKGLSSEIKLVI